MTSMIQIAQNPEKHASWLRQSLAHDKKPLGLLLGAGCPAALSVGGKPLVPAIEGLTRLVSEHASEEPLAAAFKQLVEHFTADNERAPNVEDLLTFCRSLLPVAGKSRVRDLSAEQLRGLDRLICSCIGTVVNQDLPDEANAYRYVASWAGSVERSFPVEVFTTNYDLLMEQALERARTPYFDGFVGAHRSFFDPHSVDGDRLPPRWARLWKIHGSVNWWRSARGVFRGEKSDQNDACVIHPSHLKYEESRRMPYIALMDRLRAFLRQPNAFLVSCGFSFQDQHVNGLLLEALQGNPGATLFALFRRQAEHYPKAVDLALQRSNLTVLAADGGVVGTRRICWTQVPASSAPVSSVAVKWTASSTAPDAAGGTPPTPAPVLAPRFTLGDFSCFGAFIDDLIGPDERHDYR